MSERSATTFSCAIVGAKFRPPALGILAALCANFPLVLRREPGNVHDANAIQVMLGDSANDRLAFEELDREFVDEKLAAYGFNRDDVLARLPVQLGYIPRDDAERIAALADQHALTSWWGVFGFDARGQARVSFQLGEAGGGTA